MPLLPAPGLADLDRLISRTASAGVQVDVTRFGRPREVPASIDLSAYRIVQEALTNVVKHARTSSCRVLIGYGQDELILEVTDNGAGLPAMAGAGAAQHGVAQHKGAQIFTDFRKLFDQAKSFDAVIAAAHRTTGAVWKLGKTLVGNAVRARSPAQLRA